MEHSKEPKKHSLHHSARSTRRALSTAQFTAQFTTNHLTAPHSSNRWVWWLLGTCALVTVVCTVPLLANTEADQLVQREADLVAKPLRVNAAARAAMPDMS